MAWREAWDVPGQLQRDSGMAPLAGQGVPEGRLPGAPETHTIAKGKGKMQNCPNCHSENMDGQVFCQHCGVALIPMPLSTRQFAGQGQRSGTGTLPEDGVVMLHIDGEEMPHTIQLRDTLVLGRFGQRSTDAHTTFFDLTPYHAEEKGVSRRHARLPRHPENRTLTICDLSSTNGSHLNGESLPPSEERLVKDGDEILLGKLKLYIYFRYQD